MLYFGLLNSFKTEPDVSDCFTLRQTNIKYKREYKRAVIDENMQRRQFKGNKTTNYALTRKVSMLIGDTEEFPVDIYVFAGVSFYTPPTSCHGALSKQ